MKHKSSVEDIANKSTTEDTPLSFSFNIGDAAAVTSVTATSGNPVVVPNNPAKPERYRQRLDADVEYHSGCESIGLAVITVTVSTATDSMSDTFVLTVNTIADTPSVTIATTSEDTQTSSGLVISVTLPTTARSRISESLELTNGTLFKNDGTTQISNGDFITSLKVMPV